MFSLGDSVCTKCSSPASLMCQRCNETYCSTDCQILDWKEHKGRCHQMPALIPIRKLEQRLVAARSGSSMQNNKFSPVPQTHSQHRSFARNPINPSKKNDVDFKPLLESKNFTLKPKVVEEPVSVSSKGAIPKGSPLKSPSADLAWKTHISPPQGVFFDAIVQWVEQDRRYLWVTDVKYDTQLRKLLLEVNRNAEPCSVEDVKKGALVGAPLDEVYYRAEVLEANHSTKLATVRLIDYGNKLQINYHELRSSIPIMRNLNAYAINVCLPANELHHNFELETIITIRILHAAPDQNVSSNYMYYVELKPKAFSLELPLEVLSDNPEVMLRKIFTGGQKALMQLATIREFDAEMNAELVADSKNIYNIDEIPKEGAFVAAFTSDGWRRASCLGYWPEEKIYLVYLVDDAQIVMCKQLKTIPDNFMSHPMRIIAITVTTTQSLDESLLATSKKITIHPLGSASTLSKTERTLPCALYANQQKVSDVMVSIFNGILTDFDVKCWPETIIDGTCVYITHILSQSDIFITSAATMQYPEIFTSMATKCSTYKTTEELAKDDIVLATFAENKKYFRAKMLTTISPASGENTDLLKVLDIDTGCCCNVPRSLIRKPNLFVRSCPVYVKKVQLIYFSNVPTPIENNKAMSMLHQCIEDKVEFSIKHVAGEANVVDLLLKADDKQSLRTKLLPLLFEEESASVKLEDASLPPSPPISPKTETPLMELQKPELQATEDSVDPIAIANLEITDEATKTYTMDDLVTIPISEGDATVLIVLDASSISKGYITAAELIQNATSKQTQKDLDRVKKYGKCPHLERGYEPKNNEICLVLFDDDGEWYRAVCLQKQDENFQIMFVDYGNMSAVSKNNILPITKDLMFPSNANFCFVSNLPPNMSKKQYAGFLDAIVSDPIIKCKVQRKEDENYNIKIHNIEKYFS